MIISDHLYDVKCVKSQPASQLCQHDIQILFAHYSLTVLHICIVYSAFGKHFVNKWIFFSNCATGVVPLLYKYIYLYYSYIIKIMDLFLLVLKHCLSTGLMVGSNKISLLEYCISVEFLRICILPKYHFC